TTALAALVRALGDKRVRVVTLEDPIEIVHVGPSISQRAVGEHIGGISEGVAAAMREGADAIAIGAANSAAAAAAVLEAALAGHLVLAAISTTSAKAAAEQLVALLPEDQREHARQVLGETLLGVIAPILKAGARTFEVVASGG